MKTGRLLKFDRPDGMVHAYFFREAGRCRAAIYVTAGSAPASSPAHELEASDEASLEARVRAWVEEHYPRSR